MANNCCYEMKIKGKETNVKEFLTIIQYKHPKEIHFARIFSAEILNEYTDKNNQYIAEVAGDCVWSVYYCMFTGFATYYTDTCKEIPTLSNIPKESKRLNLDIEIYSTEPGMCFAEHYIVKNGNIEIDETTHYERHYYESVDPLTIYDPSEEEIKNFNEWKKEWNLPDDLTLDQLDDNDCVEIGGFNKGYHI